MTISGSYPQTGIQDQQDYLLQVNQTFKNLEAATNIVSVHSAVAPTQAALKAQWSAQVPYLPPTNGGQIQWFNPNTGKIEQVYYPVIGGFSDLYPYKTKPTNIGLIFLGEQVIGTAASISISSIPQTCTHLLIQYSVRATGVGTSVDVLAMRLNANAGATHATLGYAVTNGANPSIITTTAQTEGRVGVAPQGGMTDQNQAAVGIIFVPNYTVTVPASGRWALATCVNLSTNTRPYAKTFQRTMVNLPSVGASTSFQLFPTTALTFQRGSKAVIWGLT